MQRSRLSCGVCAAVATVVVLAASQAQAAAVIIGDSFSGVGALNGRAPDTAQTAGDTWIDAKGAFAVNSGVVMATGGAATAQLPFTLTTGAVYDLSADVTVTGGSWPMIGFQPGTSSAAAWTAPVGPWMLLGSNGNVQTFAGPATANQLVSGEFVAAGVQHHLEVVLDTTAAQWTASFLVDGAQKGTTYTFASNPAIDHIAIGRNDACTFTIQNLQLTSSAVPEPAAVSLLGLIGLFGLRRRRQVA